MRNVANNPTNKKGRVVFESFTPETQERIRDRVEQLYDGTKTLAACWAQALKEFSDVYKFRENRS